MQVLQDNLHHIAPVAELVGLVTNPRIYWLLVVAHLDTIAERSEALASEAREACRALGLRTAGV